MLTGLGDSLASTTPENVYKSATLATLTSVVLDGVIIPAAAIPMIACPDALITTYAALSLSVCTVGASIGYSIYYSVFAKKLTNTLPVLVATCAAGAGLPVEN